MLSPKIVFQLLKDLDINFFTGVPDSLLKNFCAYAEDNLPKENHVIAANEGSAVAIAAGYHLASNKVPLIYMQNSGFGNAINSILSLADSDVYSIPMILFVGWRGEPNVKDEPQHLKQGRVMVELIESMELDYEIIDSESSDFSNKLTSVVSIAKSKKVPVVVLIKKNTFESYEYRPQAFFETILSREKAISEILDNVPEETIIISTTGKTSRELYEIRSKHNMGHHKDFLTVGSMGHTSSIALGIAKVKKNSHVVCIDGDGSVLMHMGSLCVNAEQNPKNLTHIVINNGAHESVGGQPTAARLSSISKIAKSAGYKKIIAVEMIEEIKDAINECLKYENGPCLIEIFVNTDVRKDLGRPTSSPIQNKEEFMNWILKK